MLFVTAVSNRVVRISNSYGIVSPLISTPELFRIRYKEKLLMMRLVGLILEFINKI
jgi:hypothetical protein